MQIGIEATGTRTETDSMGAVEVPADRYWGAQTQRSREHFAIGEGRMPLDLIHAYGLLKRATAEVNADAGRLPPEIAGAIATAADEVASGALDEHFPLVVWQTGSGTQTNMNVNEVIANRAIQTLRGVVGSKRPVHPNDHVNMGQSSNDSFPTAMHLAAVLAGTALRSEVAALADAIATKAAGWADIVKIGRTHLMDAVPLTVGQEWGGWAHQLRAARAGLERAEAGLLELAAGGTAVGTGLNAPPGFGPAVAARLAARTGHPFVTAPDKFAALSGMDALVAASGAIRGLAVALTKIANDIRFLASGPRCGLGELRLPENEPGSSIMPGKVNPTQCEAMLMVCAQAIGLDTTVALAGAQGNFQLNVMRPVAIAAHLQATRLLGDACRSLRVHAIEHAQLDEARITELRDRSLMLVTALAPAIGYDAAAAIAHDAHVRGVTLREAAAARGVAAERFDQLVDARRMVG